jgi:hypothetical protein
MRASILILLATMAATLCGCTPSTDVAPPAGWTRVDAQYFAFYVPPDVKAVPAAAIDSFVGSYRGNAISLGFDYGQYSDPLNYQDSVAFVENTERINGHKAKVVSFHNPKSGHPFDEVIAAHFAQAGSNGAKLTFFATCRTAAEYATVRTIFRTIQFK